EYKKMQTLDFLAEKFTLDTDLPIIPVHGINRTIMAQTLQELGFKEGAEIGVAEGNHAKVLFDANPNLKLYLVDIWKKYPGYEEYADPEKCYQEALGKLKSYNCEFIRKFSMDAVMDFKDNSLDFV